MDYLKKNQDWGILILRVALGVGFLVHGWAKISRGTGGFEKLLNLIGVPMANLNAQIVPYLEFLGGIAIIAGIFTRIISVPLIITMIVAMFTIHIHYGFSTVNTIGLSETGPKFGPPGYEINIVYIAGLLSLIFTGSGKYSVDEFLRIGKKINRKLNK
ncbi:DoxX family protein [Flavitalea sp.]|nr:DoxX family protein [Flavitalea sp.]